MASGNKNNKKEDLLGESILMSSDEESDESGLSIVCDDVQEVSQLSNPFLSQVSNPNLSTNNGTRPFSLQNPRELFTQGDPRQADPWLLPNGQHVAQFPRLMQTERMKTVLQKPAPAPVKVQGAPTVTQGSSVASTAASKKKPAPKKGGKKSPAKKKNAGGGSMKCTRDEVDLLLTTIEEILPIGKLDWERVENTHNLQVIESRERTLTKLRNQHNTLCSKKPPTGDPDCPPNVRRAKRISYKIKDRAGCEALQTGTAPPRFDRDNAAGVATGAANSNSKTEAAALASACAAATTATAAGFRGTNKRKSDTAELLEAFLASEKLQAERERRREERSREDSKQWMQLAITTANTFVQAFRKKNIPGNLLPALLPDAPMSDSSATVDSDSDVSMKEYLLRKRLKRKSQGARKRYAKNLSEKKRTRLKLPLPVCSITPPAASPATKRTMFMATTMTTARLLVARLRKERLNQPQSQQPKEASSKEGNK